MRRDYKILLLRTVFRQNNLKFKVPLHCFLVVQGSSQLEDGLASRGDHTHGDVLLAGCQTLIHHTNGPDLANHRPDGEVFKRSNSSRNFEETYL